MNSENLFDSITNIDDELITEADAFTFKKKKRPVLPIIASLAAAFIIVIALGFIADNMGLSIFSGNHEIVTDHADESNKTEETVNVENTTENLVTESTATAHEEITTSAIVENTTELTSEPTTDTSITQTPNTEPSETTTQKPFENQHISENKIEIKPVTLQKASYPKMSKYPNSIIQFGPVFDAMYSAWSDDIRKFRTIEVETENIKDFSKTVMKELLTENNDNNKMLSPLNVFMALSMLAETCDGNSKEQILSLLGADSVESLRSQANKIWQKNYRDDGYMKSIISNSLWLNDSIAYNKSTINTIAEKYYTSVFSGTTGTKSYDKMLNDWIKEHTGGMLSPDFSMSENTVMTLVSTLLYQTKWANEFSAGDNEKGIFHSPSGNKESEFMKKSTYMYYYWGEKFSAISLGLEIGGSMWFILPDEGVDADEIFSDSELLELVTLDRNAFYDYEKSKFLEVHMSIPKFDISTQQDILENLKNLGLGDIADEKLSDFSPLASNPEGIFIDKINHGVRVKIDEEGVSAAAFTVIEGAGSPAPPDEEVYFTLDRPFAFVINLDGSTPLFAGVVNNP